MIAKGVATQVYRQGHLTITVSGIPAVMVCPLCNNAVIEWETAQQIEELVHPILNWAKTHPLENPTIAIAFPERELVMT